MPVSQVAALQTWVFLGLLAAIVAVKLLTGSINTTHLLYGRLDDGRLYISPGRAQMLIATLGTAGHYLLLVAQNPGARELPDVSLEWIAAIGGSQAIYLGGKAYAMIRWRRLLATLLGGGNQR